MQNPQIPAALKKEIERRLQAGLPLPPGVIAVPEGQRPPPGAVPSGVIAPGVGMRGMPQHPGMNSKAACNPIPDGLDGIKTMRNMGECNIPAESQKLNAQLQVLLNTDGDHEIAETAMGKGLFAGLKMNKHCRENLKARIVVKFEGDEKLADITNQLKEAEEQALATQRKLQEIAEGAQKLLSQRWEYAVKTYGLNPDKNFYVIDEDEGIIKEVELECHKCKAGDAMIDARLLVEKHLTECNKKKETKNDRPGPQGIVPPDGETSIP